MKPFRERDNCQIADHRMLRRISPERDQSCRWSNQKFDDRLRMYSGHSKRLLTGKFSVQKLSFENRPGNDRNGLVTGHRQGELAQRPLFHQMAGRNQHTADLQPTSSNRPLRNNCGPSWSHRLLPRSANCGRSPTLGCSHQNDCCTS